MTLLSPKCFKVSNEEINQQSVQFGMQNCRQRMWNSVL